MFVAGFVDVAADQSLVRLLGQDALFVQKLEDLLHAIGLAVPASVEHAIGRRWRFVNAVDAGEVVRLVRAFLFAELCKLQVCEMRKKRRSLCLLFGSRASQTLSGVLT